MSGNYDNPRIASTEVDSIFVDRWSPRSFLEEPLSEQQISTLFEAARWAPSCFNEQPWLFLYATSAADRAKFASLLVPKNQRWASRAPLIMFVLARRSFAGSGRPNRHAPFDAGSAWLSLALQARRLGLYAHAMAGFRYKAVFEELGVPEDQYDIMAAVVVGRLGPADALEEDIRAMEAPNARKPVSEVATTQYPLSLISES